MSFTWPIALWALLIVPVLGLLYVFYERHRGSVARRFASPQMLPNVAPLRPGVRRHVPAVLHVLALVCLLIAVARPLAAFSVQRERATVLLVMDLSKSMRATDVEPSRLDAARIAATRFAEQLPPQFQVGVVGFAGKPEILNRPTTDRVAVRRALASVETHVGTAIGDGLARALKLNSETKRGGPVAVLLLSDGNNNAGKRDPIEVAETARKAKIPVYTIGLGVPGEASAVVGSETPRPADFETLEDVARITKAEFFPAPDEDELESVYSDLGSFVGSVTEVREVTVAFLAAGLVLLAAGAAFSWSWLGRIP